MRTRYATLNRTNSPSMQQKKSRILSLPKIQAVAAWGPGLLVMLADTDVGSIVTAAQSGIKWGYRLLPLVFLLIPVLYMIQELTVRLGIFTGLGFGELVRKKFGRGWAWLSLVGLTVATLGSLVTEFTGVAGVGELYGLPRSLTLPTASGVLLLIVLSGTYRRMELIALFIGLFELAFVAVAWVAHPDLGTVVRQASAIPFGDREFMFLAAALIGSTFNPWMIFYQQSAVVDKKTVPEHLSAARWDTAIGATLTQILTAAVLVAAAATLGSGGENVQINGIGDISAALTPMLGVKAAHLVFSIGVLGASMVAAIVSSLALAWGFGEVLGYRRSLENHPLQTPWFYVPYALCIAGSAILVGVAPNLVWLNIGAQVVNAFILPVMIVALIALATRSLPKAQRLKGGYLWLLICVGTVVCAVGLYGGVLGLL